MPQFYKGDIAKLQLETAIWLFSRGLDPSSVITLAGAASNIFDALVKRSGKESFIDYAIRVYQHTAGGTPGRKSYAHHIDVWTAVIPHKHLGESDSKTIDLDLQKHAADSLIRAVADYATLYGKDEPHIEQFLRWCWKNHDGASLMKQYKSLPKKMRPKK